MRKGRRQLGGRPRFALTIIAGAAVAAAIGGFLLASGSGAAAPPNPSAIVLKASQVGAGYKSAVIPGGRQVAGQVTLDLCYYTYASESLRMARLQEGYLKAAGQPAVSNEVVVYRSGGAAAALSEL
ncbi:MAG TPA: hypothetical protein VKS25_03620, partial [Solirubrobacteraceae bacterium]|nr:hypothetical protein [Solirubrobacteraceae bacterium]